MTTALANNFISLVGSYEIHPHDVAAFAQIATGSVQRTRETFGCLYYIASQDLTKPTVFHLAEGWVSQTHLDSHLASTPFKEMLAQASKLKILKREIYVSQSHGRTLMA